MFRSHLSFSCYKLGNSVMFLIIATTLSVLIHFSIFPNLINNVVLDIMRFAGVYTLSFISIYVLCSLILASYYTIKKK